MTLYELKRADGKVVTWTGTDGEDAARRYVDSERVAGRSATVVASREPRHGLFVLGRHARFTEAGDHHG